MALQDPLFLSFLTPNPLSTTLVSPDGIPVYRTVTSYDPFRSKVTSVVRYDGLGPCYPSDMGQISGRTSLGPDAGSNDSLGPRNDGGVEIARVVWKVYPRLSRSMAINGREVSAETFLEKRGWREKSIHVHTSRGTFEWTKKRELLDSLGTPVARICNGKLRFRPFRVIPTTFEFSRDLDATAIDEIVVSFVLRHLTLGGLIGATLGSESAHQIFVHIDVLMLLLGG